MKNEEDNMQQEEINNPAQFQVGRSPQEEKENSEEQMIERDDDAGYTPEEDQFADGKGTQLNEEIAPDRGDIEDELSEHEDDLAEQQLEDEELDEDFENFKADTN
ncbi:MAG: hypothetical protein EOO98_00420 [Pedobacter sp.]|nr:MAG: hypothetical protein EOO98_00420 [Pedobacter sp.]